MKALQRRRTSGASVDGKLDPALRHRTSLTVQLVVRYILDAADMPLLDGPRRLDAIVVKQTHAGGVAARRGVEDVDQRLDEDSRLVRTPGATSTVLLQLLPSDVLRDICKGHTSGGQLCLLRFPQQGQVTRIPLEDAGGQLRQEDGVEGVCVGGAGRAEATDEVPHIQSHRKVWPHAEHAGHRTVASGRTAVPVYVHQHGRRLSGCRVPTLKSRSHLRQTRSLGSSQHTHEHLAVLVADVRRPRSRTGRVPSQLLCHLKVDNSCADTKHGN